MSAALFAAADSFSAAKRIAARVVLAPIRFYRQRISPNKPPCCRFSPTCSKYAQLAIEKHGAAKGLLLAFWRLLRCNPFSKGGYDPVPPKGRWRPVQKVALFALSGVKGKRSGKRHI